MGSANPLVRTHDGVGVVARGNLIIIVYAADARLHRTAWLFDQADELAARTKEPFLTLMVIGEHAAPPDAATRAENARRFKRLDASTRKMVTVALGDAFKMNLVRAVMRAMLLLQGQSSRHHVAATVDEGVSRILREAGPTTPGRDQILADVRSLFVELGVPDARVPASPVRRAAGGR